MTTNRVLAVPLMAFLAFLALGCSVAPGPSGEGGGRSPLPTLDRPLDSPLDPLPSPEPVVGEVPEAILTAVRTDLAQRLGRDVTAARVVVAEEAEWNDGSLGCPEPGMLYTQAVVPGYRIVVEVDGVEYDYRTARQGGVRLCEPFRPPGVQP